MTYLVIPVGLLNGLVVADGVKERSRDDAEVK